MNEVCGNGAGYFERGSSSFHRKGKSETDRLFRFSEWKDDASGPGDMDAPGWRLHGLKGKLKGHWAVWVDGNTRLTFLFDGMDAVLVDYQDYH